MYGESVYLFVIILGLIVGSFLTALVARYGAKTIVYGRSSCSSCGTTLGMRDLIPVLSFLIQRGKCRHCESKISTSYLITELFIATLFVLIYQYIQGLGDLLFGEQVLLFVLYAGAFASLYALSLYDLEHFIIPDGFVVVFIVLGYMGRLSELFILGTPIGLMDFLAGVIVAVPFLILWIVSRGTWIGFGDVKLSVGVGGVLGISSGFTGLMLGIWIGALISLLYIAMSHTGFPLGKHRKQLTIKSEVPFGPYLALGTLVAFFYVRDVLGLTMLL